MTSTQDRIERLLGDDSDPDAARDKGDSPRRLSRRATLLIAAAVVIVLAAVTTWVLAFSSLLGVRNVQVHGADARVAAQVRAVAGIAHGTPLLRVDTVAATRRIEKLRDIRTAQVRTSMPSTVVITVAQRTPVGYVRLAHRDHLLDRTGVDYRTVMHAPAGLPKLVVPLHEGASAARGVAQVAAALPRGLAAKVHSIQALDPLAISLLLTRARVVQWGNAARSTEKARVLQVLLGLHHSRWATSFDVSNPAQPFTH